MDTRTQVFVYPLVVTFVFVTLAFRFLRDAVVPIQRTAQRRDRTANISIWLDINYDAVDYVLFLAVADFAATVLYGVYKGLF
jgi:hypothetical protein